jgi:hypothetical protein
MSDNYQYEKSLMPQSYEFETPMSDSQFSFVPDTNGGIYPSTGLSCIKFDCTSIYNNSMAVNPAESFILMPISLVSAYVSSTKAGTLVAPTAAYSPWAVHGL